jgi:hypothetical protein
MRGPGAALLVDIQSGPTSHAERQTMFDIYRKARQIPRHPVAGLEVLLEL